MERLRSVGCAIAPRGQPAEGRSQGPLPPGRNGPRESSATHLRRPPGGARRMSLELNEILKIALKGGASDIHLKSGLPPIFRVDGALVPLKNAERLLDRKSTRLNSSHVK